MKKVILSAISIFLLTTQINLAQNDCGDRFQSPIFSDITVTQDVPYGSNIDAEGNAKDLKFDFYEPAGDDLEARPLIIWAHGGSFLGGDENSGDIVQLCEEFSKRGYVNASINYRLLSFTYILGQIGAGVPVSEAFFDGVVKAVFDMKSAIRFFRKDAATDNIYNIDPNQIYVGGASAGAITAIHAAYLREESDFDNYTVLDGMQFVNANGGFEGDSGNDGYSSEVSGVINLCGAAGSVDFIQADEVPIVSIHGSADGTVPYEVGYASASGFDVIQMDGSFIIEQHANDIGLNSALWTLPGQDHMAHASSTNFPQTVEFVSDFLYPLIICDNNTGIAEDMDNERLAIYPNPAENIVNISLETNNVSKINVAIYDNVGRLVKSFDSSQQSFSFDSSELAAGVYHINLSNKKENISQKLVIK
ncbi:MAG: T9SS type A sorting domain-containing protein [Chitinophagales bacterium]